MSFFIKVLITLAMGVAAGCGAVSSSIQTVDLRDLAPTPKKGAAQPKGMQKAVFAGGCFWGVDAVFEHVKGVIDVRSGYSGGTKESANYDDVSGGRTPHAEAVEVTFDPQKVTYQQLLNIFFAVAHDPTQLNFQGPDHGPQYRSAIFYSGEDQKNLAQAFIDAINKSKALSKPVVTEVVPLNVFYEAEAYHQDYLKNHLNEPYIIIHDLPKLEDLKKKFPELYIER